MRPTKISTLPATLRQKRRLARQAKKAVGAPREDMDRLLHELANQLTVINLSCFKLRGDVTQFLSQSSVAELDRVERAVIEMTSLVETLHPADKEPAPAPASAAPPAANVYRLFNATKKR